MIGSTGFNSAPGTDRYLEKARAVRLDHARRRGREIHPDGLRGPEPAGELQSATPFIVRRIQLIYPAVPGPPAGVEIITDPQHPYYRPSVEEPVDPDGAPADGALHDPEIQTVLEELGLDAESIGQLIEETTPSAEPVQPSDESSNDESSLDDSIDKLKGLLSSLGHDTSGIDGLDTLDAFLGGLVEQFSIPPGLIPGSDALDPPDETAAGLISTSIEELTAPLDLNLENLIPMGAVELPEVEIQPLPMVREENFGEGDAKAISTSTGSAFARTGPGSVGNADARSSGEGEAIAVTGDDSEGKAFASTNNSDVIAGTGEGSLGNATASAAGEGQAAAITGDGSEGSASARANGDGTAQALTGPNSKGDAASTTLASGGASAITGQDSLGKAIAISEGEADATAATSDGSVGNATASSAGKGAATAATGFNSGGDSTAISRGDGDAIAQGGANSTGLTRAEAHKSGRASAVGGDRSRGQSIAEALGAGNAISSTEEESQGNAIAKSKISGNAAAEAGKGSTGNAHAIANAAGSATAGTGDGSTGNATAKTDGPGDVSAVTGNGSSGHATSVAADKGGSASAIVTNESAGNASAFARGKGNVFAVADGKGDVSAIAERDGGLLVLNASERPILVENRSNIDVEVLNISDKAVRVEVTPAGITNISVPGFGTRSFEGNSFTILQDGAVVAREIAKPVPDEVGSSIPTVTPPEVNVGPLELTSISPSSETQQDSVTLITGFEESGQNVDTNPFFITFSDFNPDPVSPEQFLVGGLPSENLISVVSHETGDARFDFEV